MGVAAGVEVLIERDDAMTDDKHKPPAGPVRRPTPAEVREAKAALFDVMAGAPDLLGEFIDVATAGVRSFASRQSDAASRLASMLLCVLEETPEPRVSKHFDMADVLVAVEPWFSGTPAMAALEARLLGTDVPGKKRGGLPSTMDDLVAMAEAGDLSGVAVRFPGEDGPDHALSLRDWPTALAWFEDVAHHLLDPELDARPTVTGTWSGTWSGGQATPRPIELWLDDIERLVAAANGAGR